jgi:hypothetical protein
MFGDENYFFQNGSATGCAQQSDCIFVTSGFAWNHGDYQQDITRSWFAMVGPGVKNLGRTDTVFSDHADVRPTMLTLLGLKDDYVHDGRVLAEWLDNNVLPQGIHHGRGAYIELADVYKQLNAPLGLLGRKSMVYANRSIIGSDATYANYLSTIGTITSERNSLATKIKTALDDAAFGNKPVGENSELGQHARALIDQVENLADGEGYRGH